MNCQSCLTMSYPWGTNLHNFHFTTIHRNVSLFSQDGSWQLTNLLYHVSRVNSQFHVAIKINLLQLKYTHMSDILVLVCIFLGTPPCTDIIASFWGMWVKTHNIPKQQELCFLHTVLRFHTYLFIFIHGKTLLIFLLSLIHQHYVHSWS